MSDDSSNRIIYEAFGNIDSQTASMSIEALADALLHVMVEIRGESKAMLALLEFRADWSAKRVEFRNATLRHIARTLACPNLPMVSMHSRRELLGAECAALCVSLLSAGAA